MLDSLRTGLLGAGLAAMVALAGCGSEAAGGDTTGGDPAGDTTGGAGGSGSTDTTSAASGGTGAGDPTGGGTPAPEFEPGQGTEARAAYPAGPYGIGVKSVIPNFKFYGYVNPSVDKTTTQVIELADFYNPTGTDVYPEGSPYGAGKPKPKALLIDVASVWCGPCNQEAKSVIPGKYAKYAPMGGQFLLQLADGPTPGTAALIKHLTSWTTKYKNDFPSVIDPSYKLMPLLEADAFPGNMIVKTKDMSIVKSISGVPDAAFWTTFEKVLNDQI